MNTEIQDINDLQRAVVAAIIAHPVPTKGCIKEAQDRRDKALFPIWAAFPKAAKNETERLRRQILVRKLKEWPWYLHPESADLVEQNFRRIEDFERQNLNTEVAEVQAAADARAEGAAYVEQAQRTDALARLPSKERQAIAREKRVAYSLKKGAVPMERSAAHLFWSAGNDRVKVNLVQGRIDYRVLQTLAVCARRLIEECGERPLAVPAEPVFRSAEELEKTAAEIQRLDETERPKFAPSVAFTDSDFRRILGKSKLSGAKIYEIVNYLPIIVIDLTDFPGLSI